MPHGMLLGERKDGDLIRLRICECYVPLVNIVHVVVAAPGRAARTAGFRANRRFACGRVTVAMLP